MNEQNISLTSWRLWLLSIAVTSVIIHWPTWGTNTRSPQSPVLWSSILWEILLRILSRWQAATRNTALCMIKMNIFYPVLQDVVAHARTVLEVTLPQYLDEIWTHRHLQVSNSFTVKSCESKQVQAEIHLLPDLHMVLPLKPHLHIVCPCVCVCRCGCDLMLQVFEGGWGCKTELVLSGCQICTSVQEHCKIVEDVSTH